MTLTDVPNLTDNRDGTFTLTNGLHGDTWTIRDRGNGHYLGDLQTWDPNGGEPGSFAGTFRAVLFNCGGPLLEATP